MLWHLPDSPGPFPAVVVCHPHPLYGGDMNNNVVFAICQALAEKSMAALRFNFRGVGQSSGEYGEGIGERDDVRTALALATATFEIDPSRLGLCGYSFGAHVAVPVAAEEEIVKRLALVAPYLTEPEWTQLKSYSRPLYIIHGERDFIISPDLVQQHLEGRLEGGYYEVIKEVDHFLMGHEALVAGKVASFFAAGFKSA